MFNVSTTRKAAQKNNVSIRQLRGLHTCGYPNDGAVPRSAGEAGGALTESCGNQVVARITAPQYRVDCHGFFPSYLQARRILVVSRFLLLVEVFVPYLGLAVERAV